MIAVPRGGDQHGDVGAAWPVPVIGEHDTWISVDPIIGCQANCTYCYLGTLELRASRPTIRISPGDLASMVERYLNSSADLYGRLARTPICFGNYTDTFMSRLNIAYFLEYARLHARMFRQHPLCVVTKARLSRADLIDLSELGHPILIFMSQSFLRQRGFPAVEKGPVCRVDDTIRNIGLFRDLPNIKPLHFLRPVTRRAVASEQQACEIITLLRSAGCLATVAVGLKRGPGVQLSRSELAELGVADGQQVAGAGPSPEAQTSGVIDGDIKRWLLDSARSLGYPLYLHTSCALALAAERAEELGTWREPTRRTHCLPSECPSVQRVRCEDAFLLQPTPTNDEIFRFSDAYGLDRGAVRWSAPDSALVIRSPIRQYAFNKIVHALPYRVIGNNVERDEAWLGTFSKGSVLVAVDANSSQLEPSDLSPADLGTNLHAATERLRHITGFVTTLYRPDDPRPLAFARYFHVRRVVWVAQWLAAARTISGEQLDLGKIRWLAWVHDLNRWPFAHNSEKGLFIQAEDMARYVAAVQLEWPAGWSASEGRYAANRDALLSELTGVIAKDITNLSAEGRLVLLADILAGFIEDPLLAICGLDLRPSMVPAEIRDLLAMPLDEREFVDSLLELNLLLYRQRDVLVFMRRFDWLFQEMVRRFADRHGIIAGDPLRHEWFARLRVVLKDDFLKKVVFPFNNEKVAHGSMLRDELVVPLLNALGDSAKEVFTTVDEAEALRLAIRHGIVDAGMTNRYLPDLDYLATSEPDCSFRRETAET